MRTVTVLLLITLFIALSVNAGLSIAERLSEWTTDLHSINAELHEEL